MSHRSNRIFLMIAALLVAATACQSLTGSQATQAPTVVVTAAPLPADPPTPGPTEVVEPTAVPATPAPDAACPQPGPDQALFTSLDSGFCLLYPSGFTPTLKTEGNFETFSLLGPREAPKPKQMEYASVMINISFNGPADGLDAAGYAGRWQEYFGPMDGTTQSLAAIGGQPAVVVSDIPNFFYQQSAFIVANSYKYQVMLTPSLGWVPELEEASRMGWDLVTGSLVFFPPQKERTFTRPEEICPVETTEARLFTNAKDGYCLLYPEDFLAVFDFPGRFEGGLVLGDWQGFEDVRTSLTIGLYGQTNSEPLRTAVAGLLEFADQASIQDTTIGGHPAIIYRRVAEPWATRDAVVDVDGQIFTILGQPWEPERWPQGMPHLNRLWDMMINSITFFTPWR